MYKPSHPFRIGAKCMVFLDRSENDPYAGSRYVYGEIRDVFRDCITVEITKSSFSEYLKASQIWFKKKQVWPWYEPDVQLTLFN